MRTISALSIAFLIYLPIDADPRYQAQTQKESGAITGTVKRDGKAASGITVIATPSMSDASKAVEQMLNPSTSIKATTDSEGVYRLEGLAAGKYSVSPSAAPLISSSGNSSLEVTVGDGSTVEDINFSLSLGGVITGRITDSEGRPVIGERVSIKSLDEKAATTDSAAAAAMMAMMGDRMYTTDDRGIYRIFGLKPGRYIVSSGKDSDIMNAVLSQHPERVQTFYPGVTDESKATAVQVTAGSEAAGVDIQFSNTDKGFFVAGRVIDAEKGTAIPNAMVAYSKEVKSVSSVSIDTGAGAASFPNPGGFTTTNNKGEYRFTAVAPGNYKLEATSIGALSGSSGGQFYADPLSFEVKSSNLDKLDIKVHSGASITGVVAVESTDPQDSLERFGQIMLMATVIDSEKSFSSANSVVGIDGSFRLGGLKPGKATLWPMAVSARRPGLLRIERNGVEVKEFEIHPNEEVTGIRVIISSATCVIRGHVTIQGGALQPGAMIRATARTNSRSGFNPADLLGISPVEVGGNGSFIIDNLTPGSYEVEVFTVVPGGQTARTLSSKQAVTVTAERPAEVELILDLGKATDK